MGADVVLELQTISGSDTDKGKELSFLQCLGSHSILATFKTEFEARRKYLTVAINGKPVRLQRDTASDISLISKRTWQMIGQPPVITSDKKAMNVSGGFLQLTGELECDVSFDGTQFT
ncbi:unnamed protein product [Dibothriocephalus latus]|uniref:Uncharacterized protein n=1 Tax=Dibothriocephalus latus TaxID=60516 RepID=A0A3P6Q5P0_DIBLA|nr:unnamed protein product [Dibothriocephalus latus]